MANPNIEDYEQTDDIRDKSTSGHDSYNERFVANQETSSRAKKTNNWRRVKAAFLAAIYITTGAMAHKGIETIKETVKENDTLEAYVEAFDENYIKGNTTPTFTKDGVYYRIEDIAEKLQYRDLSQADYYAMFATMGEHATNEVLGKLPNSKYKTIEENLTQNGFYNNTKAWRDTVKRSLVIKDELSSMFQHDVASNVQTEEKSLGGK